MFFFEGFKLKINNKAQILFAIFYGTIFADQSELVFINDENNTLHNTSKTIAVIPITDIKVNYHNNSNVDYEKQFTDSFFIESANDLITYECSKYFSLADYGDTALKDLFDSSGIFRGYTYSRLKNDSVELESFRECLKEAAQAFQTDLILFPYSCSINHNISQQKGWRGLSSTAGPVKYSARTNVHVQIWTREGELLYEKIGWASTGRPMLYSIFRKRKMNRGIVSYAKHLYTSPLVRSLYKAIERAMDLQYFSIGN